VNWPKEFCATADQGELADDPSVFEHVTWIKMYQHPQKFHIEFLPIAESFFTYAESFCTLDYSKYQICKDVELSADQWNDFFAFTKANAIEVIPCVLDVPSFHLALDNGFQLLKLHATDLLNIEMLELVADNQGVRVLLETQCATKRDIDFAWSKIGPQIEAIFQGFSNYPTDYEDLNLNALDYIGQKWGVPTGLADHSLDTLAIPAMALAKGTAYLEKHITISRALRHYDWQVSLEPEEFAIMVQQIRKYEKALGPSYKHPVARETTYRDIMYKKYVTDEQGQTRCLRSDHGQDFYQHYYSDHDKNKVIIAVIARLKSVRLPRKIFKQFMGDLLVFNLIKRLKTSEKTAKVVLATSFDPTDQEIIDKAKEKGVDHYAGDPLSVLDRMLDLAEEEKAGAVIRVTGDNPLTDPAIIDRMIAIYQEHDLDYVRTNNLPFGLTGELFSIQYLTKLYREYNPLQSEYLTWFVMQDQNARKGCIDFQHENDQLKLVGYSIDYQKDLDRLMRLLDGIDTQKFESITLKEVVNNLSFDDLIGLDDHLRLPAGKSISFREYFDILNNMDYIIRENYSI
jgi:spore coat polysaccharide biosynthesis protein SpsF (cytidylyltransferase family)